MKIFEVADDNSVGKLAMLANFILHRLEDTGSSLEVGVDSFIKQANNLGIFINKQQLAELSNQPPLNTIIMPFVAQNDTVIKFQGAEPDVAVPDVNQSQQIVSNAAKRAMARGMKK